MQELFSEIRVTN